jgi:hypothetical protein
MRPGTPTFGAVAWALLFGAALSAPAYAAPTLRPCGTAKAAAIRAWPGASFVVAGQAHAKDGHLLERDAFGALPHVVFSEHFALKWGPDLELDDSVAATVIEVLEEVLAIETGALAFPPPDGNDLYFFNVYVGDSGDPAPPSLDVAGYFAHDEMGAPYLVFNPAALDDEVLPSVAAHELVHALQAAGGRFAYTAETAWFAEATAEWAIAQVFPDDPAVGSLGFGMTLAPHLALDHYEPFDDGAGVGPYHPYGAFLFFQHAVDRGVDVTWVADLWTDEGPPGSPLDVVNRRLDLEGLQVADVAVTMALANATYDYAFGEQLRAYDDEAEALFGTEAARVGLTVNEDRRGEWTRVALARSPQPGGYSLIDLAAATDLEERVVRFQGDSVGEDGGLGRWHAWLLRDDQAPEALEVTDKREARIIVEGPGALRLVVALSSGQSLPAERFSYRVLVGAPGEGDDDETGPEPEDDGTDPPPPGCGCMSTSSSRGGGLLVGFGAMGLGGLALSAARRGRRRASSR